MSEKGNRMDWLDITKTIGLFFVLLNHSGLYIAPLNYFGGMFYVAVFFVVAGYTFQDKGESIGAFCIKKAKRLLVPYIGYNLFLFCFFIAKDIAQGKFLPEQWKGWLFGILYSRNMLYPVTVEEQKILMPILNGPTWFLTGLFIALIGFRMLLKWSKGQQKRLFIGLVVCFVIAALCAQLPILLPWSLDTAFLHVFFMGCGYMFRRDHLMEYRQSLPLMGVEFLFICSALFCGTGNLSVRSYGNHMVAYSIAAVTGSYLAMRFAKWLEQKAKKVSGVLAYFGRHTMGILCLHLFAFTIFEIGFGLIGLKQYEILYKSIEIILAFIVLTPFWKLIKGRKSVEA